MWRNRQRGAARPGRAFTLIELVMVLMVAAILASAAAPRYFHSLATYRLQAASQRLVADLRFAQDEARRRSTTITVVFIPATDRYQLLGVADIDNGSRGYEVNLAGEPHQVDLANARFGGNDQQVVFSRFGLPNATGDVRLACGSRSILIEVSADGTVTIP